jgi:hypothetical protein
MLHQLSLTTPSPNLDQDRRNVDRAEFRDYSALMIGVEQQWNEYKRRRNLFLLALLGYMPVVATLGSLIARVFHTETLFPIVAFGWMGFLAISALRLNCWPCPRCGKWFAATWWYRNPFARRCVHCGLPKYSNCR